jgi:4-diphosphocytidyl-2-C-methyl-D-erythritol kinase
MRILCPAKINTYLAVGAPDETSYHPVRTVMECVSLFDVLDITPGEQMEWTGWCNVELPYPNTLSTAIDILSAKAAMPPVRIRLEKNIPMQSGLGGGSSDAAGLLRGIRSLFPGLVTQETTQAVAREVGVDTPFFLVGGRALGEGYGERITPLPDGPERAVLIAKPEVGGDTPAMYRRLDEVRPIPSDPPAPGEGYDTVYNDFERVAPCESLELIERMRVLGATAAGLTGSGTAVYGFFCEIERARSASQELDTWTCVCQTLPRTALESLVT